MSWFSQFLGMDAASAQQDAIGRQQEQAENLFNRMQGVYDTSLGSMTGSIGEWKGASNLEANNLMGMGRGLMDFQNKAAGEEFRGALKDIFDTGRQQASQSGLIGGYQESLGTTPAIAALGRSFTTQQNEIRRQGISQMLGLGQQAASMRLSPYAQESQQWGSMAQGGLQSLFGAGQGVTSSLGNYSQGPNPLGNIIGGIGSLAGAAGSFMSGGKAIGMF